MNSRTMFCTAGKNRRGVAGFSGQWAGQGYPSKSVRRRIMAALRSSCMVLGFKRKNHGIGALSYGRPDGGSNVLTIKTRQSETEIVAIKRFTHTRLAVAMMTVAPMMMVGTGAMAANECGVATAGGTITCDGDGTPATDTSPYSSGISYISDGLDLIVNGAATTITTITNGASGVSLVGTGNNPITATVAATTSIDISGHGTSPLTMGGIRVEQQGTGATTVNSAGDIKTVDYYAHGIVGHVSNVNNTETLRLDVTGGTIDVMNPASFGIYALHRGLGAIEINSAADITAAGSGEIGINVNASNSGNANSIQVDAVGPRSGRIYVEHHGTGAIDITSGGDIITTGSGHGISAHIVDIFGAANTSIEDIIVDATGGNISTTGNSARGIYGRHSGSGTIDIDSAASISTIGDGAQGIYAFQDYGTADGLIDITSTGSIATTGASAHAIEGYVYSVLNTDDIQVDTSGGPVTASGADSHGIYVHNFLNASDSIIIISNTVTGGSGAGVGVNAVSRGTAAITLNSGANVSAASGRAIVNDAGDSTTTVNTGAVVAGDIVLNDGSDNLTFAGGDFTGVTLFDGGDDLDTADGFTDVLTFAGSSGALAGATVTNWESVVINAGSTISFSDNALNVGTLSTAGTGILDASGSALVITGNLTNNGTITMLDGTAGDTVTVSGDYTGPGTFSIDTDFAADATDSLIINGSVLAGITTLDVNALSATGSGNDILVVDVVGAFPAGLFILPAASIAVGGTSYQLEQIGTDWFFTSICIGSQTIGGATSQADVLACQTPDTITVTDQAQINGDVEGAGDIDIIVVSGDANVTGVVRGGGDGDYNSAAADLGDFITIDTTGTIGGVDGDLGDDVIALVAGTITNDVDGNVGNDTFSLTGAIVQGDINGGDGNDVLAWASGNLGAFHGGDGSDVAVVTASTYDGTQALDGGDDADVADGFIDELTLNGVAADINSGNIENWEVINLVNSNIEAIDLVTPTLNVCGGSTTLKGVSAVTDVLGCVFNDNVEVTDDTIIANVIEGAGGADTIVVSGNASVTGGVYGAAEGQDVSALADGDDLITINTTGTVGLVDAGIGDDMVDLLAGTITTDVFGQDGADTLTLAGAAVGGTINAGAGVDMVSLTSGTANVVLGGDGADTITLDGAIITNTIDAGLGDDAFTWNSGTLGSFTGGDGSDAAVVTATEFDGSRVLDGGDDAATADGFIDTLTLSGLTVTANGGNITNWETVVIDGGTISFADNMLAVGADAGTGLLLTNAAVLDGGSTFALTGNMQIDGGATFQGFGAGAGIYTVTGNLTNNGTVTMLDGAAGDTVTVSGDYAGMGSLLVDADFSTDTADTLVVNGNVAGGTTTINVRDVTAGAQTGNDVLVVDVTGAASEGDFVLAGGTVTSGAFNYALELQGTQYFLAGGINSTGAVYEATLGALLEFANLPTLEQRVGTRQKARGQAVWGRIYSSNLDTVPDRSSAGNRRVDSNIWGLQLGVDVPLSDTEAGALVLGVTAQHGSIDTSVANALGTGSIDANGYGAGMILTWYGNNGIYVDAQGQVNFVDSDIGSSTAGNLIRGQGFTAHALSIEAGKRITLNSGSGALVPQAQLTWSNIDGDGFADSAGNAVNLGSNSSTIGRVGLAYEFINKAQGQKFYVIGNLLHDFSASSRVNVAGAILNARSEATWGELGLGANYRTSKFTKLYGEASYSTSFSGNAGNNHSLRATVGLRIQL